MLNFSTPLSALRANAVALDVVANNIANANTEGYARRTIHFSERPSYEYQGHLIGQGVDVAAVRSSANDSTAKAINQNVSDTAAADAELSAASELETLLSGPGSLTDRIGEFFNQLGQLTATPDDVGAQTVVIQAATSLAGEINGVSQSLEAMLDTLDQRIQTSLDSVSQLSEQLIQLDDDIARAQSRGTSPLDLIDRRNSVLRELSVEIDVRMVARVQEGQGVASNTFYLANGQASFESQPAGLFVTELGEDVAIFHRGAAGPLDIVSGRLGGLLEARNALVKDVQQRVDGLTAALVAAVDGAHATGVGTRGSFTSLDGQRQVDDVTAPLSAIDGFVQIESGSLFVTVTDTANDSRSLHEIVVDPSMSLVDVAGALSRIDHIQGIADDASGQLSMLAAPGFTFDFTGGVSTEPTADNIAGTAHVRLSGEYSGDLNGDLDFRFVGSGTIGVSSELSLEVRDQAGAYLGTFNVGQGYSPGREISIGDGLKVSITTGTIEEGDRFAALAVSQPDETGLLVALGVNTLFSGQDSKDLQLNQDIVRDPTRLASTKTGDPLDTTNLKRMLRLRDGKLLADGSQSFEVFLANAVATVGAEVSGLMQNRDNLEVVGQALQAEWMSQSGVDENEEIVLMLQYQRGFQSAARYISAIDESLRELFNILQ